MDRAVILDHLAQAERHVEEGARHVERQRQIVAELERDGHDTTAAKALLSTFEASYKVNVEGRDRLREEVKALRHQPG